MGAGNTSSPPSHARGKRKFPLSILNKTQLCAIQMKRTMISVKYGLFKQTIFKLSIKP